MRRKKHQPAISQGSVISEGGFTLLELVVVIIVISLLALAALDRIWSLRVQAERAAVEQVVGNIRSALGLEVARRALGGELHRLPELNGSNPIALLAQAPASYLGVISTGDAPEKKGVWYFDPDDRALVYQVIFTEYFVSEVQGPPRIRFRVKLVFSDRNNNRRFDPGTDTIDGLDLFALDPYHWNIP